MAIGVGKILYRRAEVFAGPQVMKDMQTPISIGAHCGIRVAGSAQTPFGGRPAPAICYQTTARAFMAITSTKQRSVHIGRTSREAIAGRG